MNDDYEALMTLVREVHVLGSVGEVLGWDQETYMPANGVGPRAEQQAAVATVAHERQVNPRIGELAAKLDGEMDDPIQAANVREARRDHERAVKIPGELVARIAKATALSQPVWRQARKDSDFARFAPNLTEILELKREVAERVGYDDEPYDALLDEFEPGESTSRVADVFQRLRGPLSELVLRLTDAPTKPDASILSRRYPRAAQEKLARRFAEAIGFDFKSGRLDVSTHPFCSSTTPHDVRLTTRYNENAFASAIFGVLHEAGHGLYEQGLDPDHMFTPAGSAVSLGIHESQSRLWENLVGRSRSFWEHFYGGFQDAFAESLSDVPLDDFVGAINCVRPSMIRVEADEVTYNLHIILRFELERMMVRGDLAVADVPEAWNEKMRELLGITPENDAEGCLQDVHWSIGVFGYFPTYALGNLYAAQFYAAARQAIGDLDAHFRRGDFSPLLEWLRTNIHQHGMRYRAGELVERVTGAPLSMEPLLAYLRGKILPIYGQ